jgi:hypothetical protein
MWNKTNLYLLESSEAGPSGLAGSWTLLDRNVFAQEKSSWLEFGPKIFFIYFAIKIAEGLA